MNVLSLFSGIGGLDLGLERAGMTVVGQVEIDPWCRKVLAKHWPEVPRHDDVRTAADWWGDRPAPDLVAGGFPCQPVSVAGKGLAQADSRWLWPAFAGVVRHLRPRYVLVENVPGLLGRGMGDVLGDLAAIGYDAEWDCVPAAVVGAPHIRNRVWIVAYPQRGQLRQQPGRRDGTRRAGAPVAGDDGAAQPLADTQGRRCQQELADSAPGAELGQARPHAEGLGQRAGTGASSRAGAGDLAAGVRELGRSADVADPGSETGRVWTGRWEQLAQGGRSPRHSDHWATEPDVGRVAHGIPARVDRLRGLGNAVVPQVAEHVGRLILAGAA